MDPGNICAHDLDFLLNGVVRAATDIRDEKLHLKAENERLEKLLAEITPELKLLREERVALKAAIRVLVPRSGVLPPCSAQKPATFATLPYEILQPIFNFATVESTHQFDPSIQPGAYSPWLQLMRIKKGFPLVCRATFWPGMSALYGDIVFRRMGQVSALAETLRAADVGPRLGNLIKSIRWDSCVVSAQCSDIIRDDLAFIFGQCTQLQFFSYHPHHNFPLRRQVPDHDEWEGFFNPLWFVTMPASLSDPPLLLSSVKLRSLDLSVGLEADDDAMLLAGVHRVLLPLKALESLILGSWPSNSSFPQEIMEMPVVSFPSLTDLRIFAPGTAVETYLCSRWDAPHLSRLTVCISAARSPMRLLERFGSRLRYLHLCPTRCYGLPCLPDVSAYFPTFTSALSTVCPLLEHLIAPDSTRLVVDSPTLAHLDFWTTDYRVRSLQDRHQSDIYRGWIVDPDSNAPSLRTVRLIFTLGSNPGVEFERLHSCISGTAHPDWPWICHPSLLAEDSDDVLYYQFPLGRVVQTAAAIIPQDLWEGRWSRWPHDDEVGDWPAGYPDLDGMQRIMDEERADSGRGFDEEGAQGEETTSSDWNSTSDDSEEEGDGGGHPDGHEAVTSANTGGTGGSEESQDVEEPHEDPTRDESHRENQLEEDRDGEMKRRQVEAAAELVSAEYPPPQLDRTTILDAFRRGRDRESYNHVALWDDD